LEINRATLDGWVLKVGELLTRFLEYPELELSTNLAENSMRPVAIGRKNWLHIGSPQAGPKVAAILSVVESCRRLKLPVRDYLAAVLPGLADLPIRCLPNLAPAAWLARHSDTKSYRGSGVDGFATTAILKVGRRQTDLYNSAQTAVV